MTPEAIKFFTDAHQQTHAMIESLFWWMRLFGIAFCALLMIKLSFHIIVFLKQLATNAETNELQAQNKLLMERMNKLLLLVEEHGGITERTKERAEKAMEKTEKTAEKIESASVKAERAAGELTERVGVVERTVKQLVGDGGEAPIVPHGPRGL